MGAQVDKALHLREQEAANKQDHRDLDHASEKCKRKGPHLQIRVEKDVAGTAQFLPDGRVLGRNLHYIIFGSGFRCLFLFSKHNSIPQAFLLLYAAQKQSISHEIGFEKRAYDEVKEQAKTFLKFRQ